MSSPSLSNNSPGTSRLEAGATIEEPCGCVLGSAPLTEPATTLTDFFLAALGGVLSWRSLDTGRVGAPLFFGAFAIAALLGGIVHGFLGGAARLQPVVWWLTIVFTGAAGAGLAAAGLECLGWRQRHMLLLVCSAFTFGVAVYAWSDSRFLIGIAATGVGGAICVVGLVRQLLRGDTGAPWMVAGLLLSVAASVLQQRQFAIDPVHFDHNATFHVILIPSMILIYAGARRLATTD